MIGCVAQVVIALFQVRLKKLRENAGFTQDAFAKKIGVAQSTIGMWESGRREPDHETTSRLADFFDVSIDYIVGRIDDQEPLEENTPALPLIDNIIGIETQKIPLLGEIAAGSPIFADEQFECYVEVGAALRADFALRVKGDSMVNARILDGDLVFIRQQPTVSNGEIAAVLIGDDATLKRFYREGDVVTLMADNPAYPPVVIRLDMADPFAEVRVLGKAVAFQSDVR